MNRIQTVVSAAVIAAMLVLSACQPKPVIKGGTGPLTEPAPDLKRDVSTDIAKIRVALKHVDEQTKSMPGRDEAEYRQLMTDALTELLIVLPAVHGSGSDGRVAINQTTIRSSRDMLQTDIIFYNGRLPGQLPLDADSASTVATALRAAADSLNEIAAQQFADQPAINATLKSLTAKLNEFDTTSGPMVRQVGKEAVILITDALQQMVDVQAARAGIKPTTQP